MMKIPNADFLARTKSEILGARLWRLPPGSANTLHRHPKMEEFYFVVEGVGRIRIGDKTITVPKHGGVLVGPEEVRQVFNDTEAEVLWLIVGFLTSPDFAKVSRCAGEGCGWFFIDRTPTRRRRWCSMQGCGNRAKAHTHYQRHEKTTR